MAYLSTFERNKYSREYNAKNRKNVFSLLGKKCSYCGFSDIRALQIDHINGGGLKERKLFCDQNKFYRSILRGKYDRNKLQILCANCNWIKKFENRENPKIREQ